MYENMTFHRKVRLAGDGRVAETASFAVSTWLGARLSNLSTCNLI